MYDDRYDGKIDEAFFQKKLKEYKDREFAINQEMESHAKADESFHVTANMVLSLARRSREIFESSEVDEKRQLLNFVFQNLELKDKKLSVTLREPLKIIKDTSLLEKCPGMCPAPILHRTNLSTE
jgi:site-specific DNA recombinase